MPDPISPASAFVCTCCGKNNVHEEALEEIKVVRRELEVKRGK